MKHAQVLTSQGVFTGEPGYIAIRTYQGHCA